MTARTISVALALFAFSNGGCGTGANTLATDYGLFGWCIYEPTTYPKELDEHAGVKTPLSSDPSKANALAQFAGNKFSSWTLSRIDVTETLFPRIYVTETEPTPDDGMTSPLRFLERTDDPTTAQFFSFSGCSDAPCIPLSVIRQFSLSGGGPMRGITISQIGTPNTARDGWNSQLRLLGITPIVTR